MVMVSVLMPTCLASQQGERGQLQPQMGSPHPPPPQTPPPRAASAGDEASACGEASAEDGACLEVGLLQSGALLSAPVAPSAGPAGAAEASGSLSGARSPPLAALGLHAGLLLGGERGRHLSGSGLGTTSILIIGVAVVALIFVYFAYSSRQGGGRGGRDDGMPPSRPGGFAAKNLLEQQPQSRGGPSGSRSPAPTASSRAQPSPPGATVGVGARSPRSSPQSQARSPPPAATPAGPQPGNVAVVVPPATAPSRASPRPPPSSSNTGDGSIPILCRSLVLPNLESCFNVSMEALANRRFGNVSIKGASARSLLEANIQEHQLSMRSVGSDAKPRVIIRKEGRKLSIYGRDEKLFGTLEPASGPNDCALLVDGQVKLKVLAEPGPELQFRAFATDGRQVAAAGSSGADWTLQVKANVDAILIASCMLGMIFFASGPASGTASAARSPPPAMRSPQLGSTSPHFSGGPP